MFMHFQCIYAFMQHFMWGTPSHPFVSLRLVTPFSIEKVAQKLSVQVKCALWYTRLAVIFLWFFIFFYPFFEGMVKTAAVSYSLKEMPFVKLSKNMIRNLLLAFIRQYHHQCSRMENPGKNLGQMWIMGTTGRGATLRHKSL